ncbi:MAG: hypothetical protein R3A78_04495 [Polyangiales bacterium]|nr:hypothetical protein [Myxococcales bacterium]
MDAAEGGTSPAADAREARGREEFNRGKAFYVAGNHADALTAFRASIEAYPSATAYLLAARCLRAMGRLGEAVVEYEHAVILGGTHASENAEYAKTSQVAADELAELARKVARVRLHVTPADAHAAVRVAGRAIPDDARERAWPVTPGTVRVEAFAEGFAPFETELVVRAGDEVPVEINLSRAPGEAGGAPVPSDTTPAAIVADGIDADASPGRPPWGAFAWASVGLAAVGAAAFTAFYILADGQRDDYRAACVVAPCSDAKQRDLSSTGTTYQTLTNIGLAVGIAGAALALTFFLLDMDADEARAHEASLVPEVDGAGVRWRF